MTRAILTCSPHFTDLALNELRRCHPETIVSQHVAPGYVFIQTPHSFEKFTSPWRHRLPIYLHHLFPVHAVLDLDASYRDLETLKRMAEHIARPNATLQLRSSIETGLPYSLPEIQEVLSGKLAAPSIRVPKGSVLSILIAQTQAGLQAFLGVSSAVHNLSPWAGGQIPITEPVSNRAGYKLLEALHIFGIRLRKGDHALDLGAAPGAWTTLLRRRGLLVTAVAPAPLYPWLTFDAGVSYQPMCAEDYLGRCRTTFDLMVNDMKLDARDSARLMVAYAEHLRREGIAIMTLKLRRQNQQRIMDHCFRILRKCYKIIRVRQLVSNRNEVTLFLRRKA